MNSFLNKLKRADSGSELVLNWVCVITEVWTCAVIVIGAAARYIFKTDLFGAEELILFAAFWLYFIGSALGTKEDSQISADMTSLFIKNKKVLAAIRVVKFVISFLITSVGVVWAYNYVVRQIEMNAVSNSFKAPLAIQQASILACFILSAIYLLVHIVKSVKAFKEVSA